MIPRLWCLLLHPICDKYTFPEHFPWFKIMKTMMIMCVCVCLWMSVCVFVCKCMCACLRVCVCSSANGPKDEAEERLTWSVDGHSVCNALPPCILYFAVLLCSYTPFLHIYTLLAVLLYSLLLYSGIRTTTLWPSACSSGMWMVTLVKCVAVFKQNWVKEDHVTSWYIGLGFCCFSNVKLL